MKNTIFSRVKLLMAAAFVLASVCAVTGCLPQTADPAKLNPCNMPEKLFGSWVASNDDKDVYTISGTTFSNAYDGTTNYTINNVEFVKIEDLTRPELEAYYLYCKADKDNTVDGSWGPWTYYHKDNYTAVYLEITGEKQMIICCANNWTLNESENPSLDYVKSTFTLDNGYFGSQLSYKKQ